MPELNFDTTSDLSTALAGFVHNSARVGEKTKYTDVPCFYLGGTVKEHFPYKRGKDGKKIVLDDSGKYTKYATEDKSDGFMVTLQTAGVDPLYVVLHIDSMPQLTVGSLYKVSGLGYGQGDFPTYLDEDTSLTLIANLQACDAVQIG